MQFLKIPAPLLAAIHNYLQEQPFREVAGLISALDTQCSQLEEPSAETTEPDQHGN